MFLSSGLDLIPSRTRQ